MDIESAIIQYALEIEIEMKTNKTLKKVLKNFFNHKEYIKRTDSIGSFNFNYFVIDFLHLLKCSIRIFTSPTLIKELNKTKKVQNLYKEFNAFVFANGPSLNKLDFRKVREFQERMKYKLICINSFVSHTDILEILKPDIYVLSDPAFFGYYDLISEERKKEIITNIKTLDDLNVTIFAPIQFYNRLKIKNQIYYFNDVEFRWWNKNITNITKPRSYLSMTGYKALSIACFLGFKKIYIAGFDNNWFKSLQVNNNNEIFYANQHFKKQADSTIVKVKEFEAQNIGELLFSQSFLFNDLYKFPKEKIINLDPDSLTDAFSKEHNLDVYKEL